MQEEGNITPTPVTILTGFLGAGKTTLLNKIIEQNPATRFAIIENEFGEIGIDQELIIGVEDGIFEMSNGCICCTLNSEMAELLAKLIKRRDAYDHILIETTGIADPASVAAVFISEPAFQKYFRLDAVLCLVDVKNAISVLEETKEAAQQISFADTIILNKIDLLADKKLDTIKDTLLKINPYAACMATIQADVDTKPLLDQDAFTPTRLEKQTHQIQDHHDHQHGHITSQSFVLSGHFDLLKFRHFMQVLLLLQSQRIYRIKGILSIAGEDHKTIFQAVQKQTVFSKGTRWNTGENRQSKLIVIGNNLNRKMFEKKLKECLKI